MISVAVEYGAGGGQGIGRPACVIGLLVIIRRFVSGRDRNVVCRAVGLLPLYCEQVLSVLLPGGVWTTGAFRLWRL